MAATKSTTKKTSAKTENAEEKVIAIEIPEIKRETVRLTVVGDSPLLVHEWSDKAKQEILDKQRKRPSKGREVKNPVRDYVDSLYWIDEAGRKVKAPKVNDYETDEEGAKEYERIQELVKNARFGFPATAFKACAIDAGFQQGYIPKKTTAMGAFHILSEFVEINGKPEIREDMVKVGGISKVADIRYRGAFFDWSATLTLQYNPKAISVSEIANLLNLGGFSNGVGEWRPSRRGLMGRFHVQTVG